MPKTKMKIHRKIIFPVSKEFITEHHLKAGDILTIAKVTNGNLVLMPKKEGIPARVNGRSRNVNGQTKEIDNDRDEWMSFALSAWDGQFGDNEPEYTSDMIKVPNPDYERR